MHVALSSQAYYSWGKLMANYRIRAIFHLIGTEMLKMVQRAEMHIIIYYALLKFV